MEVSIAASLDASITASGSNVQCPPITFVLPVIVIPPGSSKEACLPAWTSLCLIALAEDESSASSPQLRKGHPQEWQVTPCQTIKLPGSKRGPGGLTPSAVQGQSQHPFCWS